MLLKLVRCCCSTLEKGSVWLLLVRDCPSGSRKPKSMSFQILQIPVSRTITVNGTVPKQIKQRPNASINVFN